MIEQFSYQVKLDDPDRLDQVIAKNLSQISRNKIQQLIREGCVTINGETIISCRYKVHCDDKLLLVYQKPQELVWQPSTLNLDIVYEDDDIYVINKSAGLIMHPGAGQIENTLANALLNLNPGASLIPRAGIVHRLDKDTSGICICAKTNTAYLSIVTAMKAREITRKYKALVHGEIFASGHVAKPIGRHKTNRIAMAVIANGKPAKTNYDILEKYQHFTWLELTLETGRTHQIRVHMAHIKHPIAGDKLYNKAINLYPSISVETISAIKALNRQALHAFFISFRHPVTKKLMNFEAPVPNDIRLVLDTLTGNNYLN